MPAPNVIELRHLLTRRFPGLRTRLSGAVAARSQPAAPERPEESAGLDLPPAALTEIVAERRGSGSALLLAALIRRAMRRNQWVALVDGCDSFDVARFDGEAGLAQLLWVRCRCADEALKAADLLLRDRNLPSVLLDLAANPAGQLRKIPATTWYRFQRLVEQTSAACVVLTPSAMVGPARVRIALHARFPLAALDRDSEELFGQLKSNASETRRSGGVRELLQNTA